MVQKRIVLYGNPEVQTPFNSDQLVVEIGNDHIALMVKNAGSNTIGSFELFETDSSVSEWPETFFEVRNQSDILKRGFNDTKIYYNLPESVIIPSEKFEEEASEDFLNVIYGDKLNAIVKHEKINASSRSMENIYRIDKSLNDVIKSNFVMLSSSHVYSKILTQLLGGNRFISGSFLKVQFYYRYMVVVLVKYGRLQMIQTFSSKTPDDVVYHLLNVVEQFSLIAEHTDIELSGIIDKKSQQYELISKIFPQCSEEKIAEENKIPLITEYPEYYFIPFLNLVV